MSIRVTVVRLAVRHAGIVMTNRWRHHPPPPGAWFALGAMTGEHTIVGVAIVGRPVPPYRGDGRAAEITRLWTDGTPNVAGMLCAAAWRTARRSGCRQLITHSQAGEIQRSLRAEGLKPVAALPPRAGSHTPRRGSTDRGVDGVCRTRWEISSIRRNVRNTPGTSGPETDTTARPPDPSSRGNRQTPTTHIGRRQRMNPNLTPPADTNEELYTYEHAANRLYVSTRTLRRLVARGRAPHRRIGRLVRFTRADLDDILSQHRVAARPRTTTSHQKRPGQRPRP